MSRSNPAQHYAVYVPASHRAGTAAPILFIMDYRGRARVAADVFRPAADRYGWILMSSNHTSSDEAAEPSLEALRAMWDDAHDLFDIDPRRIYLAGLSGTARTATWIASQLNGEVAGVIGAAAGLSPYLKPSAVSKFLYAGTVGDEDYNYWEMRRLERDVTGLNLPSRFAYFSGPHGWMPPDVAIDVLGWFEIKAMQRGHAKVDSTIVDLLWSRDAALAAALEAQGQPRMASRRLGAMARDYADLMPAPAIAEADRRSDALARERRSQADEEAERHSTASHAARIATSMQIIARAFLRDAHVPAVPLAQTLADLGVPILLRTAGGAGNDALDARRLLAELDVQTGFYLPMQAMEEGDDNRARYYLEIARAINPRDGFAWYLRGRLLAKESKFAEALSALGTAVDRGFRTLDALESDRAFDPLRNRDDFHLLVARVRTAWLSDR